MLKEEIKAIILSQQEWLVPEKDEILREELSGFSKLDPFAYILTGVRRSGKSTMLKQIMQIHGVVNYFNFEDSRAAGFELTDFLTVEALFLELFGKNEVMCFDEIQNVEGWERYVRDAADRKKTLIITGSNARMLSRELGTKLTGRHLDYEVFPFSYQEFLQFTKSEPGAESFGSFLQNGGFPGYLKYNRKELLSILVSDILIRDIFTRYNLRNQEVYRRILQYLLSNTGKEVSFNNIKNTFEVGSASSVMDFLGYLSDTYLMFLVPKYDTSLKVQARNPRKIYGIDQGLVHFSSLSGSSDSGRLLENAVFLKMKREGKGIWYFRGKRECDFVCKTAGGQMQAVQVTWQVSSGNEKRETEGLLEAMDRLNLSEGTIITFDQEDLLRKEDKIIRLVPVWKWMG